MASDSEDEDLKAAIAMSLSASQTNPSYDDASDGRVETELDRQRPQTASAISGILGLDRKAMEQERLARLSRKRERSISPPSFSGSRKAPKLEAETVTLPSGAMLRTFSTLVDQDQQARKSGIANAANKRLKRSPSPVDIKSEPQNESTNGQIPPGAIKYPKGVVKKTWAFRHDRTGDDIKLEEVLEPQTLKTALLSAFQWDTNWVLAKLKTPLTGGSTKCAFVMQAKEDKLREEMLEQTADWRKFLRLCFPSMEGQIHCMHSKLMLLFHPEKLRIAIPTANLLDFDWGESGVMENSVFMIDLPRLPDGRKTETEALTFFGQELLFYLEKQGLDQDIRSGVLNFDFAATADMAFVHTVGGTNYGEDAERTGLPGLARAVRSLNLQTTNALELDFAASSIGSLNDEYLRAVHAAARGEDMFARAANQKTTKPKADFFKPQKPSNASKTVNDSSRDIRSKFRIYFPTHDTVTSSTAGGAGTICLSRKWYESSTFPRQSFRDYQSTRPGLLSHNKILYARGKRNRGAKESNGAGEEDVAWVYVGSANMSESAWGKLVFDPKRKAWKVNCRNWECGVLLPVEAGTLAKHRAERPAEVKKEKVNGEDSETESEDEGGRGQARSAPVVKKEDVAGEDSETESEDEGGGDVAGEEDGGDGDAEGPGLVGFDIFDDIVKPPCRMPGARYEGRQPWYFQERR